MESKKPIVSAIAAIGRNRELGKGNDLLWRIPEDLKRVRTLTMGHPLVMGRKTFDSILTATGKPLLGRTSIVITRDANWQHEGAVVVHSIQDGIEAGKLSIGGEEIFVFGGAQIYEQALPLTDKLYITIIDDEKDADSFFPTYENEFTKKVFEEEHEWEGLKYLWVDLER